MSDKTCANCRAPIHCTVACSRISRWGINNISAVNITGSRIKLDACIPVYCKRNIVHRRRCAVPVGPVLEDEVYEVEEKSLNGDGARSSVSPLRSADWTAMRAASRSGTF